MNHVHESRAHGAVRWIDAVTRTPISRPLIVRSSTLRFIRNLSGLAVITDATGLEAYAAAWDPALLPPDDSPPLRSQRHEAVVEDPSGAYLPTRFEVHLPRDPSPEVSGPDQQRPEHSVFTPLDVPLLPSPAARLAPGCAQVRVAISDEQGRPRRNVLARVVHATSGTILGVGLSDSRGEALVAITGLRHFAPGETEAAVVRVETAARLELVPPSGSDPVIDWTTLRDAPAPDGFTDPEPLALLPGRLLSRRFPFTT